MRSALVVAVLLSASACQSYPVGNPRATVTLGQDFSQPLPLAPIPEFAVVPVSINGQEGFKFLLDTGATPTALFLTDKVLALGLVAGGRFSVGGAGEGKRPEAQLVDHVSLGIGGVQLAGLTVIALPADSLPDLGDSRWLPFDGIIGYDLYSRFAVTVDPIARHVRLQRSAGLAVPDSAAVLPLKLRTRNVYLQVPLRLRPTTAMFEADLHLDTGMTQALALVIDTDPGLPPPEHAWRSRAQGLQGNLELLASSASSLQLGRFELRDAPVSLDSQRGPASGRHGRIGAGALDHFRYTIDYGNQRVILERPGANLVAAGSGFVGFSVLPYENQYRIRSVVSGSPAAEAGISVGQRVLRVDDTPASTLNWLELDQRLHPAPGTELKICVDPEAEPRCVAITAVSVESAPPL